MSSIKKQVEAQQKKEVMDMLKSLISKIKNGEVEIKSKGCWQGVSGNWTYRVDVKDSKFSDDSK